MPQSLASMLIHIIFSTKNREDLISSAIEAELYAYIGGILSNKQSKLIAAGGTANHLHLLISLNKNIALSALVGDIKRNSSRWIKTKDAIFLKFEWQDGYGAFSIGQSSVETVKRYIANQKAHHKAKTFENEIRGFFDKYEIEYDERYLWD